MAVGDITRVWSAAAEVPWTSDGPASLADAAFTGLSDEVDSDAGGAKVLDIQVAAKVTTGAGSPATQSHVAIWAATPADDSNYGGSANWVLVGVCFVPTAATAARSPKFSLAAAFCGALPKLFKLALEWPPSSPRSSEHGLQRQRRLLLNLFGPTTSALI